MRLCTLYAEQHVSRYPRHQRKIPQVAIFLRQETDTCNSNLLLSGEYSREVNLMLGSTANEVSLNADVGNSRIKVLRCSS